MNYGTLNALFYHAPVAIGFLVLVYLYRHRQAQKPLRKHVPESKKTRLGSLQIIPLMMVSAAAMLASSVFIDGRWDDLRHTFDIPVRSIDALLIVGFAGIGVYSLFLLLFVILVKLYDKVAKAKL